MIAGKHAAKKDPGARAFAAAIRGLFRKFTTH